MTGAERLSRRVTAGVERALERANAMTGRRFARVRGMNAALGGAGAPACPEGRCRAERLSRRAAAGAERALQRANTLGRRRGFTLLEVVVALTLGSMVVLMAHRILIAVIDGAAELTAVRGALDREANARRLLANVFGSLDVTGDSVAFTSWHRDERGFRTRSRVTLTAQDSALVLLGIGPGTLALLPDMVAVEFDYLLDYGARERWVREWISPASAPAAVRLRMTRRNSTDTLLLIIGGRG
jgi:prepilin-type N-terminal cleavage/methylation domain-containing protein